MYDIKKFRSKRPKTKYIILAHAVDLIKKDLYINPIVNRGTYKLTWDIWQEYWYLYQKRLDLPCHFFVELLNKDYVVFTGLAMQKKSYFLNELAEYNIIKDEYRDSLLVIIGENFKYDLPEQRMYEHIANRILSPMCYQYQINFEDRVLLLDECLTPDWEKNLKESKLGYDFIPMELFNKDLFLTYSRPFMKLIQNDGYNIINR